MRVAVSLRGNVQGVGFRPFVHRGATMHGLAGWVRNTSHGVQLEVEGQPKDVEAFLAELRHDAPARSLIDELEMTPIADRGETAFYVASSDVDATARHDLDWVATRCNTETPRPCVARAPMPLDAVVCEACLAEVRDPTSRRYGYALATCADCGPRYSVIHRLPYDRQATTLRDFPMCAACRREYHDPGDRRFHVEGIACATCGPELKLSDGRGAPLAERAKSIGRAAALLAQGRVVALKGIGGFQLLAEAKNPTAVARLRQIKARDAKPFAVMFPNLEAVSACCQLSEAERRALSSSAGPIVLLQRRNVQRRSAAPSPTIADGVAPDNPRLGCLLPTSPLHALLLDALGSPVVCTSANLAGDPLYRDEAEARAKLTAHVEVWLTHDRPIQHRIDDSVVQQVGNSMRCLRAARGLAPHKFRRIAAPSSFRRGGEPACVLALGAQLKSTLTLAQGDLVTTSPQLGDLGSPASLRLLESAARDLLDATGAIPDAIVCDLHPDYASTHLGETLSREFGVPLTFVQHHHAHVAACRAEHQLRGPLLGLSWDGIGFGDDRTAWGGEALLDDGADYQRIASLRSWPLLGGDRAAREPWRVALTLVHEWCPEHVSWALQRFAARRTEPVLHVLECLARPRVEPSPASVLETSSMGRLFDAVAAILGFAQVCSFEGQAAMQVQFAAERAALERDTYPFQWLEAELPRADFAPTLAAIVEQTRRGVPRESIARRFINSLVRLAVETAERASVEQVALTGGCFQNALLLDSSLEALNARGFRVFSPERLPPNDSSISLGQAHVASLRRRRFGAARVGSNSRQLKST